MDGTYSDASNYKFEFDLGGEVEHREDGHFTQYIEISCYEISSKKVWKYFRGHVLIPLTRYIHTFDRIEDFDDHCQFTDQGAERKFVSPNDFGSINIGESNEKSDLLTNLFTELKTRNEGKQFVKHREVQYINCKTKNKQRQ